MLAISPGRVVSIKELSKIQSELQQKIDQQRIEINQTSQKVAQTEKNASVLQTNYEALQILIRQETM